VRACFISALVFVVVVVVVVVVVHKIGICFYGKLNDSGGLGTGLVGIGGKETGACGGAGLM
jgi:hypothetical protein